MTRREQIARALRTAYLDGPPDSSRATAWEDLPHERQRMWLALAATAEREVAAANEREWVRVDSIRDVPPGTHVQARTSSGGLVQGTVREFGLGYVYILGVGSYPLRPELEWYARRLFRP